MIHFLSGKNSKDISYKMRIWHVGTVQLFTWAIGEIFEKIERISGIDMPGTQDIGFDSWFKEL